MNTGGLVFLCVSWAVIISLCLYSFSKVLKTDGDNMKAPLEIDTEPGDGKRP